MSKNFEQLFYFSDFFDFFIKKCIFLKNYSIHFSSCFASPLKSFKDIIWEKLEKNQKKLICEKISNNFFFQRFFRFLIKKSYFSKTIRYFFLVVSLPLRRVLKTFSEKNLKKKIICPKISNNFLRKCPP